MATQAQAVLKGELALTSRHTAKVALDVKGSQTTGKIHSLRTFEKYTSSLKLAGEWAHGHAGLRFIKDMTPALAQAYLEKRAAEGLSQKQLDADRSALQFVTGRDSLERVTALNPVQRHTRAYTRDQVHVIATAQNARNQLATDIAYAAGLRAHELLTLQRGDEAQASGHRDWWPERFQGRAGVRYIVTGKGGLSREVLLPHDLAERLEARRRVDPVTVTDRGIRYAQRYDLGGGNAWSKSVSDAAQRVLGWSTGAHGLRHSYAQERMQELQTAGKTYTLARQVVSQELGHFRGDVVETYLR